ncbi:MAG: hypothetical protein JJU40_05290 [Rhodobacteraceae bacterium]|nr:hypothetical protein [Paracoccaceae bacterium]
MSGQPSLRLVAVKTVSIGSGLELRLPPGEHRTLKVRLGALNLTIEARGATQPLVYTHHQVIDLHLSPADTLRLPGMEAATGDAPALRARLHPNGVLKLFYVMALRPSGPITPADRAEMGTALVRLSERHAPFVRALHGALTRARVIRETGPFPLDSLALGPGASLEEAFDEHAAWRGWVSTHLMGPPEAAAITGWDSGARGAATGSIGGGAPLDLASHAFPSDDGDHAWQVGPAIPDDDMLCDILDAATVTLELRTMLDVADTNITRLARSLSAFLARSRDADLATIFDYLVAIRARLSETEARITAMDGLFRTLYREGEAYHRLDDGKTALARDFETLQLAIQARRQREADRFSRLVTLIGLAFTAFSFVSTSAALVDYLDHSREFLDHGARLGVVLGSLLVGALGIMLALFHSRRPPGQ